MRGRTYRTRDVITATGASYRQLTHWRTTGLLVPSIDPPRGSGTLALYSDLDVAVARVVKHLVTNGSTSNSRRLRDAMPEIRAAVASGSGFLIFSPLGVTVAADATELADVVARVGGTQVVSLPEVARSASSASPAVVHGGAERAASGCTHVEQAGATSGLHAGTEPAVAATQGGAAGLLDQPGRAAERDTTSASDAEVGRLATAS